MRLTDIFIKRPVLSTVISLLILALGIRSIGLLPVRQYPFTQNAVVTVQTTYTGADPDVIAGFITTPLENSIAQAGGIDYMTSTSTLGASSISINLNLNYDPLKALSEITSRVNAVLYQLPRNAQQPVISIDVGQTIAAMYLGFYSSDLPNNKITDYLIRVVQPKLQAVNGVQTAEILGNRQFAMRIWLDPAKLAGYNLTAADVSNAIASNNYIAAAGRTDGNLITVNLIVDTDLTSVEKFKNMVVKAQNGAIIRLQDVGVVSLGASNYSVSVKFDNQAAIYIGIKVAPAANLLTVIADIKKTFPILESQLPHGLNGKIVYDSSAYVNSSINEVEHSLIESFAIVSLVIFIFLGSLRAVIIPLVAIPLSLVGAFFVMLVMGFSINLLTLLALVLAIGLVVDDAIIVVENIQRHLEEGKDSMSAALLGAHELAGPIIAISIVLIAVYVPIGFMGGLTGALFTEFAFTLVGAVTVSAIIALTLSPMMGERLLKAPDKNADTFVQRLDRQFEKLRARYERGLQYALDNLRLVAVFAVIILCSNYFLFISSQTELAPQEDQGVILAMLTASPNGALPETERYGSALYDVMRSFTETNHVFQINGSQGLNSSIAGMVFKPWDERKRTPSMVQPLLQDQANGIAGAKVAAFQPSSLPGGGRGLPVQFVITTTDDFAKLQIVMENFIQQAQQLGMFLYSDSDLKIDMAQTKIELDRDKVAQLGLSMKSIGDVLSAAISQGYVNYFNYDGRAYQVIPQVNRADRYDQSNLLNFYINTQNGKRVPFTTFAKLHTQVVPESINHFQQLNSATFSAIPFPGVTTGQAIDALRGVAAKALPAGYSVDFASQSRQYVQESDALMITFFFALIIIFLSLSALFESFRDPLIVLISVPMSICGAMIFISMGIGQATLNIYSEVGLVTLIGLISKHGILIVQFANDLQAEGKSKLEAIRLAAALRFRPILMTTAAMVLGVVPLIFATGAGAMSRYNIGLVIATGIAIGTLFTLFVVPVMYMLLATQHHHQSPEKNNIDD